MRNVPQPSQQTTSIWTKREDRKDAAHVSRVYSGKPSSMFDLFENKAEVKILNSEADDRLASSMYCGAKVLKKKNAKKQNQGTSGYNFDSLLNNSLMVHLRMNNMIHYVKAKGDLDNSSHTALIAKQGELDNPACTAVSAELLRYENVKKRRRMKRRSRSSSSISHKWYSDCQKRPSPKGEQTHLV